MTNIKNSSPPVYEAFPYIPANVASIISMFCIKYPQLAQSVTEIRLRLGGALSLSVFDKNVTFDHTGCVTGRPYICTKEDIDGAAALLCGSSFHSHKDELEKGYISSSGQVRAGVSTYGTFGGAVWGIDGLCIRIPRDIDGCSAPLLDKTGICSMLICSAPGVGKTTLLRDMARRLCAVYGKRIVVCDTKYELLPKKKPLFADYICGKEKAAAIECATRNMSAQVVLCDELGGPDETKAVLSAQSGGVALICTAHADCMESLLSRPNLKLLYDCSVFEKYVFLKRNSFGLEFDIKDKTV
ncbi:MAG: hypothetical protein IJT49_08060 [Clostridia bacterium]|nr:hypothetical protein [Clostridia bacterium]